MNEWCPKCEAEEWNVLDYQTDFEIGSVTMWWKCRCDHCGTLFEIVREYNLDPRHSYVQEIEEE